MNAAVIADALITRCALTPRVWAEQTARTHPHFNTADLAWALLMRFNRMPTLTALSIAQQVV